MARTRNTTDKHDEALKVFILNDQEEKAKNESLKLFVELYSMRLRTDREFWLLDATALINDKRGEVREIMGDLAGLKLDLDDDLFILNDAHDKKGLEVFEFYEIHPTVPRQVLHYGNWDSENGLRLTDYAKWERRRDLQVICICNIMNTIIQSNINLSTPQGMTFRVLTEFSGHPYITKLDLIPGTNGLFEMDGMFAEVFFELQVIFKNQFQ